MLKINFDSINKENFTIVEQSVANEKCFLVIPKKHYHDWEKHTLMFRSSIWNENGEGVSFSFKKFFNWDERSDLTYKPFSLTANGGVNIVEKIDGSTLIVSNYKGELLTRTRGTFNAKTLDNGYEIDFLKTKYPYFFTDIANMPNSDYSVLFEWVTPSNKIVLPFSEPDIYLTAIINHNDYSLRSQKGLDDFACEYKLKRPKRYQFDNIKDMVTNVTQMKDFEGVCVYCNYDQDIRKLKTEFYLKLHRAITQDFASFENIVEFYFANNMSTTYQEFYDIVTKYSDFEVATQIRGDISRIIDAMKEVRKMVDFYKEFTTDLRARSLPRKLVAEQIFQKWGDTGKAGILFKLYDNKPLEINDWKKIFYQTIKQ